MIESSTVPFLLIVRGYVLPGLRCERGIRILLAAVDGEITNQNEFREKIAKILSNKGKPTMALWLSAERAEVLTGFFGSWGQGGAPHIERRRREAIDAIFDLWPDGSTPSITPKPHVSTEPPLLGEIEAAAGQLASLFFPVWSSWRAAVENAVKLRHWGEA
jgi:hypothetical protein